MTPPEIMDEHARGAPLQQRHLDGFTVEGVPAVSLARTWCGDYAWVHHDRVVFDACGDGFEFERYATSDGTGAFTFVVFDEYGCAADIAAWRPPALAFWLGRVALLGQEQVLAPRVGDPLQVHASVTDWFRAAREGVFITDFGRAAHLLRSEALVVETGDFARQLRRKLTTPAPPIHVRVCHQGREAA